MTNQIQQQEQAAIHYIDTHIINSYQQAQTSEISTQNYFFSEVVVNYLKNQALNYIGQALKQLAINHLIDLAQNLLENLQDYLLTKYQEASEEEKVAFKKKILEKFPDSKLAKIIGDNHD